MASLVLTFRIIESNPLHISLHLNITDFDTRKTYIQTSVSISVFFWDTLYTPKPHVCCSANRDAHSWAWGGDSLLDAHSVQPHSLGSLVSVFPLQVHQSNYVSFTQDWYALVSIVNADRQQIVWCNLLLGDLNMQKLELIKSSQSKACIGLVSYKSTC